MDVGFDFRPEGTGNEAWQINVIKIRAGIEVRPAEAIEMSIWNPSNGKFAPIAPCCGKSRSLVPISWVARRKSQQRCKISNCRPAYFEQVDAAPENCIHKYIGTYTAKGQRAKAGTQRWNPSPMLARRTNYPRNFPQACTVHSFPPFAHTLR